MANDLQASGMSLQVGENVYVSVPRDDVVIHDLLRRIMGASYTEYGTLWVYNFPTPQERSALIARRKLLVDSMTFDKNKIGLVVTRMLQGYGERSRSTDDPKKLPQEVAIFLRELALEPKIPTWAVALACNEVRLGSAEGISLVHKPTTMAFRALCDRMVWKVRAELVNIGRALTAQQAPKQISGAERERVSTAFRALADEMLAKREAERNTGEASGSGVTIDQLKELAGGDVEWNSIPDRKFYRQPGEVKSVAEALGRDWPASGGDGDKGERADLKAEHDGVEVNC